MAKVFSGPLFALAGLNHFVMPRAYEAILPDYLPAHRELVFVSGLAEFGSAISTLHPRTRRVGGRVGMATLAAIFPANVHMALHPERYRRIPRWALYARLPLQGVMIYWMWLATQAKD